MPDASGQLSLDEAWGKLMKRIGVTTPKLVAAGAKHLDAVDRITKMPSTSRPAGT